MVTTKEQGTRRSSKTKSGGEEEDSQPTRAMSTASVTWKCDSSVEGDFTGNQSKWNSSV